MCSFNGRLNECVRCMAFTALFTFLDHMEILQHYILTESSVWFGRGREEAGKRWLCACVGLCRLCAMSFKVKSQLPYGKMKFVCLHRLHRMELNGLQPCRMSVFVLQQMFCSCVHLALFLLTCHVSFWKKLKVHVCNVALRWKGEIETHCQMLGAIIIKNKPFFFVLCWQGIASVFFATAGLFLFYFCSFRTQFWEFEFITF